MKSRITIEVDFDNGNEPVLQIIQRDSDDVRDRLLASFLQSLGGDSSWCSIKWEQYTATDSVDKFARIFIRTVKSDQLKEQASAMLEQHCVREEYFNQNMTAKQPLPDPV